MKKILRHTWKAIKYNLGSLLLFETGYRVLTFFLTLRLVQIAIESSLSHQGFSYLTAEKLWSIYKKPLDDFSLSGGLFDPFLSLPYRDLCAASGVSACRGEAETLWLEISL